MQLSTCVDHVVKQVQCAVSLVGCCCTPQVLLHHLHLHQQLHACAFRAAIAAHCIHHHVQPLYRLTQLGRSKPHCLVPSAAPPWPRMLMPAPAAGAAATIHIALVAVCTDAHLLAWQKARPLPACLRHRCCRCRCQPCLCPPAAALCCCL